MIDGEKLYNALLREKMEEEKIDSGRFREWGIPKDYSK